MKFFEQSRSKTGMYLKACKRKVNMNQMLEPCTLMKRKQNRGREEKRQLLFTRALFSQLYTLLMGSVKRTVRNPSILF